jgi:hypothetical protein
MLILNKNLSCISSGRRLMKRPGKLRRSWSGSVLDDEVRQQWRGDADSRLITPFSKRARSMDTRTYTGVKLEHATHSSSDGDTAGHEPEGECHDSAGDRFSSSNTGGSDRMSDHTAHLPADRWQLAKAVAGDVLSVLCTQWFVLAVQCCVVFAVMYFTKWAVLSGPFYQARVRFCFNIFL